MSQRMVILGGAHCGKSDLVHDLCAPLKNVVWWGTGVDLPQDGDWQQRLAALRSVRPSSWTTLEGPWAWPVSDDGSQRLNASVFVLDSLNLWLASQINRSIALYSASQLKTHLEVEFQQLMQALLELACPVVIVSAEVGSGVVPTGDAGRLFRDLLGLWNQALVAAAHHAVFVQAGRAIYCPGGLIDLPTDGFPLRTVDAGFLRRLLAPHQLHK